MEGVVVSRQILLSNLLLRRRLVFETIVVFNWFKSMPAAFHNQQVRNAVRTCSVSTLLLQKHISQLFL
ncbi:hypothetical protein [Lapidilactobacillus wuchangensis]|uniref:hypothetical protein n=1 Tax=Lapidilactobacillus wuchangensis TaxID=2486001 RepID=UPI0013DE749B|nr:hypothetical protein [Lapidilactobacillus wuchangensis]